MSRIISDESLRRALKALAPSVGKNCTQDERVKAQAQLDKRCYGCLPAYGQGNRSAEMKQPFIRKEIPRWWGGSSDGYGIKVPKM